MIQALFATATLTLLLFLPIDAYAFSINISNVPSLVSDQAFEFKINVEGAQKGANYLRANLYPEDTTNYFGYTFNGNFFYNGSDFSQYLPISIDQNGNWVGKIITRVDKESKYYKGDGKYKLKVRRYTSANSYTWSNEATVNIKIQPSVTPTPTIKPTATPKPTPTPKATATVIPKITPTATAKPSPTDKSTFVTSSKVSYLNSDQILEAEVSLHFPSNPNTKFYIKGVFVQPGGTNYFGITNVNGNWVKNSENYVNQLPITTDDVGNWNGTIQVLADVEDAGFANSGDYSFKVGKYSIGGSNLSWSNNQIVNLKKMETANANNFSVSNTDSYINVSPSPDVLGVLYSPSPQPSIEFRRIIEQEIPNELMASNSVKLASYNLQATESQNLPSSVFVKSNVTPNFMFIALGLSVLSFGGGIIVFIIKKFKKKNEIQKQQSLQY